MTLPHPCCLSVRTYSNVNMSVTVFWTQGLYSLSLGREEQGSMYTEENAY